jgi:hypothetical protein
MDVLGRRLDTSRLANLLTADTSSPETARTRTGPIQPWFAQQHGGTAILHAASFGYLLSYPFVAALVGRLASRGGDRTVLRTAGTMALGSLLI